jgi:hypothetical protein
MRIAKIETEAGDFIEIKVNVNNGIGDRELERAIRHWFIGWLSPVTVTVSEVAG